MKTSFVKFEPVAIMDLFEKKGVLMGSELAKTNIKLNKYKENMIK